MPEEGLEGWRLPGDLDGEGEAGCYEPGCSPKHHGRPRRHGVFMRGLRQADIQSMHLRTRALATAS